MAQRHRARIEFDHRHKTTAAKPSATRYNGEGLRNALCKRDDIRMGTKEGIADMAIQCKLRVIFLQPSTTVDEWTVHGTRYTVHGTRYTVHGPTD
jgi:hypothetical protein